MHTGGIYNGVYVYITGGDNDTRTIPNIYTLQYYMSIMC